jgi:hypothetical protein
VVNALPSGFVVSPRAAANLKRSLVLAIPCGLLLLLVLALLGHPLAGLFAVLGLGLGWLSTLFVQRSVVRFRNGGTRGAFVAGMLGRLGILTLAALLAVFLVRPDGAGLLAGIAIFQVIVLVTAAIPVLKELRG